MPAASTALAAAAAAEGEGEELFDHEAATTCAMSILLPFILALLPSCLTKLDGNLKIREEDKACDAIDAFTGLVSCVNRP